MIHFGAGILLALLSLGSRADYLDGQKLTIVYRDKPPYTYSEKGAPKGALIDLAGKVLEKAGIEGRLVEVPPKRVLADIKGNRAPVCALGWYWTPEYGAYARFSQPIQQDASQVVLASPASAGKLLRMGSVRALLSSRHLTLGVVEGVSYGQEVDALISQFNGRIERATPSTLQMARMLGARRADFMIIDQEELRFLMTNDRELRIVGLEKLDFPDQPAPLKRHLMCSMKVSEETMERLNAAIRQVAGGL